MISEPDVTPIYARIQAFVCQIPPGRVCNYGRIAELVGNCTARMVGYAMSSLPADTDVPWQRVINAKGRISPHGYGYGSQQQRLLLEQEGVKFSPDGVIDLELFGWP